MEDYWDRKIKVKIVETHSNASVQGENEEKEKTTSKKSPPLIEKRSKTEIEEDLKKMRRDMSKGQGYRGISRDLMSTEQLEEHEKEKGKGPSKYIPLEEFPAPDSNPEALLMAKEEAKQELPELRREERLAEVDLARESIEKERLQRRLAEKEAGVARRGNVKNVSIAGDIKTKRIGAGDEDIENKFDERDKRLIGQEMNKIQKLGQDFKKSPFKKRPGPTPKYKTQYSER